MRHDYLDYLKHAWETFYLLAKDCESLWVVHNCSKRTGGLSREDMTMQIYAWAAIKDLEKSLWDGKKEFQAYSMHKNYTFNRIQVNSQLWNLETLYHYLSFLNQKNSCIRFQYEFFIRKLNAQRLARAAKAQSHKLLKGDTQIFCHLPFWPPFKYSCLLIWAVQKRTLEWNRTKNFFCVIFTSKSMSPKVCDEPALFSTSPPFPLKLVVSTRVFFHSEFS